MCVCVVCECVCTLCVSVCVSVCALCVGVGVLCVCMTFVHMQCLTHVRAHHIRGALIVETTRHIPVHHCLGKG